MTREFVGGPNVDVSVLGTTSWLSSADWRRDRLETAEVGTQESGEVCRQCSNWGTGLLVGRACRDVNRHCKQMLWLVRQQISDVTLCFWLSIIIIIIIIMQRLTRHVSVIRLTNRRHLVVGNVCMQSLGKAAAAATLYTESVCQSVVVRQSLSVCQWES